MKKILVPGLAAGVVMLIASVLLMMAFSAIFPALNSEYATALFRPWSDPLMYYIYLQPFVVGILLAYAWQKVKTVVKAKSPVKRGSKFGFAVWVIFGIPGMLITLSTFNISTLMVSTWAFSGLVQYLLGGITLAKLNKD